MAEIKCQHTSLPSEDFLTFPASSGFPHALTCGQGISSHPRFSLVFPSSYHLLLFLSFLKSNFIYLFLAVLGLCCCVGFPLVMTSRGYSPGSRHKGFSSCSSRALEHRINSCVTRAYGLVAPQHVGSSWIRDHTCCLLHWQVGSLPLSHQGSHPSVSNLFNFICRVCCKVCCY